MTSPDDEATDNNKSKNESIEPASKTFHYVSLPIVKLERIDDQVLNTEKSQISKKLGKSHIAKKLFKKSKAVLQKSVNRNIPKTNSVTEKRRIKLTNKGEETLHIVDFRGNSTRKFIMEDQAYSTYNYPALKQNQNVRKQIQDVTKRNQNVTKNSKTVQKPLLVVRSKTEINNLADKKLNSTPVVSLVKQRGNAKEDAPASKNLQQLELPGHPYSTIQDTSDTQINKYLHNKRTAVSMGRPYRNKHGGNFEKGNSGGLQINKCVQNKQKEVVSLHISTPVKQNNTAVQVNKDVQDIQRDIANRNNEKQNASTEKENPAAVYIEKILQNKQIELVGHPYSEKYNSNVDKVGSPTQNKISTSKDIQSKQTISSSVQGPSPAKRKLPEEHYQYNKVQKLSNSPDVVSTDNSGMNNISSLVNNVKVTPDRKTAKVVPLAKETTKVVPLAKETTKVVPLGKETTKVVSLAKETTKVVPLAKARKSITLPRPDVTKVSEVKSSRQMSDKSADNLEAVSLLSKLVGMPISADKMEVVLRKENEIKETSVNKPVCRQTPKRSQGVSNLSKLLSDSLRSSTSDKKTTATTSSVTTLVPAPSTASVSSARTTITTSTTSNITVTTPSVPGNRNMPATEEQVLAQDCLSTKTPTSTSSPADLSRDASTAQQTAVENSVDKEAVNGATEQQSWPWQQKRWNKTIYELMVDISMLYPAWNLHILQDTNSFCIACVARDSEGVPSVIKSIELDEQFNAKVFVHQCHYKQLDGQYCDEYSILSLINIVNTLKG